MSSLHDAIMNLQHPQNLVEKYRYAGLTCELSYKIGHRDARHAAAELALAADSRIEELETLCEDMRSELESILDWLEMGDVEDSFADPIRKLLVRAMGRV